MTKSPKLSFFLSIILCALISGCEGPTKDDRPIPGECNLDLSYEPTAGDSDGDGISDVDEKKGWTVSVDLNNDGDFDDEGESYKVTSNPNNPDSDGDCLSDFEERVAAIDPWEPDSDQDLLTDYEEVKIYRSAPNDIDTDDDSLLENSNGNGHQELRDYQEAIVHGTSPLLRDTDGDGLDDRKEILESSNRFFNPLIADVPKIELKLLSSPGITLKGTVSETQSRNWSVEQGNSVTDSQSTSSTYGSSTSFTSEWELSNTISLEPSLGFSYGESTTTSSMYSYTTERTQETTRTYSEIQSEGLEITNEQYEGQIKVIAAIKNSGKLSFVLENLSLNAVRWNVSKKEFEGVGTLTPEKSLNGIDLAPGESIEVILNATLDVETTLSLLKNPSSLILRATNYNLINEFDVSYSFNNDEIDSRTARIIIDYGKSSDENIPTRELESYHVAVNQKYDPKTNDYEGVYLTDIFKNQLGIDIETEDGILTQVRNFKKRDEYRMRWIVANSNLTDEETNADFNEMKLKPGDVVYLMYVQDYDGDGLYSREELSTGSSDQKIDTDEDSLSDYEEVTEGWNVSVRYPENHENFDEIKTVFSLPGLKDSDFDGRNDFEEKQLQLDPRNSDTDGDFIADSIDLDPKNHINERWLELGGYSTCYRNTQNLIQCQGNNSQFYQTNVYGSVTEFSLGSNDHYCEISQGQVSCSGDPVEDHGEFTVSQLVAPYLVSANGSTSGAVDLNGISTWGLSSTIATSAPEPNQIRAFGHGGGSIACTLDADGVYCWAGSSPEAIKGTPQLPHASHLSVGQIHACAIEKEKLFCWGDNYYNQAIVPPFLENEPVIDVSSAPSFNCALTKNRTVRCWGNAAVVSTPIPSLENPISVAVGSGHACALDIRIKSNPSLDELWMICWGNGEENSGSYPNFGQSMDQYLGLVKDSSLTRPQF